MNNRPVDVLLSRLEKVKGKFPSWMALCPSHADNGPSLHVTAKDDGKVLIKCFAGCGASDVMTAIGLSLSDLYPEGRLGELSSKKHLQAEDRPSINAYTNLQNEIYRLRASK